MKELERLNNNWNARKRGEQPDRVWIGTAEVIRQRWVKPDWRELLVWGITGAVIISVAFLMAGVL